MHTIHNVYFGFISTIWSTTLFTNLNIKINNGNQNNVIHRINCKDCLGLNNV